VCGNIKMRSFHQNQGFESCNSKDNLITRLFSGASSMLMFDVILAMKSVSYVTLKKHQRILIVRSEFDMRPKRTNL